MKISDERLREAVVAYKAVKWGDDSHQVFEDEMHAMRAALEAAVGEMVRDAERYRYLRNLSNREPYADNLIIVSTRGDGYCLWNESLDKAVDAALLAAANGEGES